jgi:hypothetical protein
MYIYVRMKEPSEKGWFNFPILMMKISQHLINSIQAELNIDHISVITKNAKMPIND